MTKRRRRLPPKPPEHGIAHHIEFLVDHIGQEPKITRTVTP
jgi:hypothetical protein